MTPDLAFALFLLAMALVSTPLWLRLVDGWLAAVLEACSDIRETWSRR